MRRAVALVAVLVVAAVGLPAAAEAAPAPFGKSCTPQNGVRFCPTRTDAERVRSFDGIPLDVDVTLPAEGDGPFPTIVMLHGYGGTKADFESDNPEGRTAREIAEGTITGSDTNYHYNNNFFARRGYAVVNYSARGFGRSCGQQKTEPTPECGRGYIHLADTRFEARDTQHLLGLLADQGVADPSRLGVTGISYGGGQSMELAYLRDRIRAADGSFRPWRSPQGTPLAIAAAYPRWPWSDLAYSLLPNGRYLDFGPAPFEQSRNPIGVAIQSYVSGLYALGKTSGYYCGDAVGSIPCTDPSADINGNFAQVVRGEPFSAEARARIEEIARFHQAFGLSGRPAPLLIQEGWTDDLFPPHEALRIYNRERARDARAPVALQLGDLGHSRGSNKPDVDRVLNDQGAAFLDARLRGVGRPPAPGAVTAFRQTCPRTAPAGAPFRARSWAALHPGAVRFGGDDPQTVSSTGGNPVTAQRFDPVGGTSDSCQTAAEEEAPGTAVYRGPRSEGFTLLGRPTVTATIAVEGPFAQLDSRLWDVAPDGTQRLVSRGAYRVSDDGAGSAAARRGRPGSAGARGSQAGAAVTFQLNGNGYRFEPGHTPKLELLGRDAAAPAVVGTLGTGYLRPSNSVFSVRVSGLSVELPTAERPNGGQIVAPRFARDVVQPTIRLTASPTRARAGRPTTFRFRALAPPRVTGARARAAQAAALRPLTGATIRFAGRRARTGRDGRAAIRLRFRGAGRLSARAERAGYAGGRARVTVVGAPSFTG